MIPSDRRAGQINRIGGALFAARLGPLRGAGLWGSLVVVLLFLAISVPQYGDPYVIDEAVFPYVADGIVKNGAPVFYNGETRPNDLGLWHPPLYDYLLAGQVGIFGMSPFAVRAFGAICVVLAYFVTSLALRRIAPAVPQVGYALLAGLMLLNPLVIGGALVPDIDGTLGVLLVALGLWMASIVSQTVPSWRLAAGVTTLAVLAASTKFTIAGLVAIVVGVAGLLSRRRWAMTGTVVASFAFGTGVALGLLVAAGAVLGFEARAPFDYLIGSLVARTPGRGGLSGVIANLTAGPGASLVWIGPAIMAAAVIAAVLVLVFRPAGVVRRLVVLAVLSGLATVVGYAYISGSPFAFPKYTPITVPAFALAVVPALSLLARTGFAPTTSRRRGLVTATAFGLVLATGVAGMYVIQSSGILHPRELEDVVVISGLCFFGVVAAAAVLIVVRRARGDKPPDGSLLGALATATILGLGLTPAMTQVSASLVDLTAPFATRYYYGERGMAEFLERAARIVPPDAEIISAKDVGLQLDRRFYEDAVLFSDSADEFRASVEEIAAPFIVTRALYDYSEAVLPEHFDVIREYYVPVLDDPDVDFTLWELRAR